MFLVVGEIEVLNNILLLDNTLWHFSSFIEDGEVLVIDK